MIVLCCYLLCTWPTTTWIECL